MKIKPFFRWYDLWIGAYIDTKNRAVYICPLPMVGVKLDFQRRVRGGFMRARGILEWREGDEPAEETIRRIRGG